MPKTEVLVLGASGMLGSIIVDCLARDERFSVAASVRNQALLGKLTERVPNVAWRILDISTAAETHEQLRSILKAPWVINAIGVIKPYIHDDNPDEVKRAITGNSLFPHWLAEAAGETGARVLQIATDCVYSGAKGLYVESDKHDALDVYGKTKSLGECFAPNVHNLRCSIIGPEMKSHLSLLEWFRHQPLNAALSGFTNHRWNGVTTLHFGRICAGIMCAGLELPHSQHIVPAGMLSKFEMLRCFAEVYRRPDLAVNPSEASVKIDRTLSTGDEALNARIWRAAGYERPPAVPQLIAELGEFDYRFGDQ